MKITFQNLRDYINSLPDDHMFDMGNSVKDESCGCVMVQYGSSINLKFDVCGFEAWTRFDMDNYIEADLVDDAGEIESILKLVPSKHWKSPVSAKELKEIINN